MDDMIRSEIVPQEGRVKMSDLKGKKTDGKPHLFKMTAPLLDQGRSNTPLAHTENMWATLKVYASGGENGLHTHPNEDHTFIVMQGNARYYGPDGVIGDRGPMEGIMLPAGAYYWFEAISAEPLVLLRIGSRVGPQDPGGRLNIRGEPMPGDSPENKQSPVKVKEGAFFGA
jgi:mannose-6-phosphate isomerase-like protein (cupin superfamily)